MKTRYSTAKEIKSAVESGNRVFSGSDAYEVIKDRTGQWLIWCSLNGYCIGLTGAAGGKYADQLNGSDFYSVN